MAKHELRTGKRVRPKTALRGKRFRCASCRKRSPRPVLTPAPWYCPQCLRQKESAAADSTASGLVIRPQPALEPWRQDGAAPAAV